MKVCEKVQKKGVTSYNEVADELVAEFSAADNHISPNDSVSFAAVCTMHRALPQNSLGKSLTSLSLRHNSL